MTLREINGLLQEGLALKYITEAFSEIAALKLKRIRTGIEKNRLFLEEISAVFHAIKAIAQEKSNLTEQIQAVIEKNGRSVSVLLTSNYRFYGSLNDDLIQYFLAQEPFTEADKVVVGKTGINLVNSLQTIPKFESIVFNEDVPNADELNALINIIKVYKTVKIYHSKFKTALTQTPTFTDITQTSALNEAVSKVLSQMGKVKADFTDYIVEPELPKILGFFDSQIITILLQQAFLESELSRTAARLIAMDQGESEADKFILTEKRAFAKKTRELENNDILQVYNAFLALYKKGINKGMRYT